jgi:hypothetical protein
MSNELTCGQGAERGIGGRDGCPLPYGHTQAHDPAPMTNPTNAPESACQTPRHELTEGAGRFLIEHATHDLEHEGVRARCRTCCHAINHPTNPAPESAGGEKMLPCPFCGSESLETDYGFNRVYVRCQNPKCYADGPITGVTEDDGIAAWNRRSTPAAPQPETEGMTERAEAHRLLDELIEHFTRLAGLARVGNVEAIRAIVQKDRAASLTDSMIWAARAAADMTAAKGGR